MREAILEVASEQLGSTEKRAMPGGWVAVANHLVAIQRGNTKRLEAEKRLEDTVWTLERFLMLVNEKCRRGDGTPSEDGNKPEPLLEWLNAAGYLFRDPRRLPDRLIIDQRWAVMAIYTLFWRKDGKKTLLLDKIELNSGRITGAELFEDGWGSQGFTVLERQLSWSTCSVATCWSRSSPVLTARTGRLFTGFPSICRRPSIGWPGCGAGTCWSVVAMRYCDSRWRTHSSGMASCPP